MTENDRSDSYANVLTAMGTVGDKSSGAIFLRRPDLNIEELNAMYEQDAMSARIVDRLPDDATREGFTLNSTEEFDFASVQSEMEDLNGVANVADAWRWSRLYGGSLLIMVVNDGLPMEEPLDLANATKLSALQIVESPFVIPTEFNPGLGARAFRNPSHYDVLVPFGSSKTRRIHRTRVIRFEGMRVPPTRMIQKHGWPPSVLDRVFRAVTQLGSVMGYSENIMHDLSILLLKIKGFRNMLTGSEEQKQEARAIIESIKWNSDNLHTIALDTEDDMVEMSRTVSGLCELLDKFVDGLVRATDMPRTVLLGEQPAGLNANADSEIRSWYDFVASQQQIVLTPVLTRLLDVIFRIRQNNNEQVPEEWTIDYNPLWQPTQKDKAETLKTMSEALDTLIQSDMISSDEGRAMLMALELVSGLEAPPDGGQS